MLRTCVCAVLALVIFVGGLMAGEGTVVSLEKGKLTLKVGSDNKVIEMKGVHVHGADGKVLKGKAIGEALKKETKVTFEEKDGKVVELKLNK